MTETPAQVGQQIEQAAKVATAVDPAVVTEAQAVIHSGPIGTFAVTAVAYVAAKFGLGLDEPTTDLIAGVGLLGAAYVAHNAPRFTAFIKKVL